jgi:hypothetical protein
VALEPQCSIHDGPRMTSSSIISPTCFAEGRREKLLSYKSYATAAEDLTTRIPKAGSRLSDQDWLAERDAATLARMTSARAGYSLDLLTLQYSAGRSLADLRVMFASVVDYFETYAKYDAAYNAQQGDGYKSPHIALADSEFHDANRLVCFAILLGLESMLGRIAAIIDFDCPAHDAMLERLLAVYLDGRTRPSKCTRNLPYSKTLKIFDALSAERERLMANYLIEWYAASHREPYFEAHKRGEEFKGYWSWEAGAITVALGIDDASFHDAQFYPRDLVDFARQAGSGLRALSA